MSEEINNNDTQSAAVTLSRNIGPIEEPEPEQQQIETGKKKKQLSEHQIEHLNKIRVKALERKREIKLQKHKQYEEECRKKRQENIKQVPLIQPTEQPTEQPKEQPKEQPTEQPKEQPTEQPTEQPKKKKTVKKIIKYVEESDDDDAEEIEEVIVKKNNKIKAVPQQVKQPENQYSDLLYNSSLERMQTRMLNERAKTLISNVMPCYF